MNHAGAGAYGTFKLNERIIICGLSALASCHVNGSGSVVQNLFFSYNRAYCLFRIVVDLRRIFWPFGRSDHVVFNNVEAHGWDEVVEEEINELRTTLDGVILSWSRVSE